MEKEKEEVKNDRGVEEVKTEVNVEGDETCGIIGNDSSPEKEENEPFSYYIEEEIISLMNELITKVDLVLSLPTTVVRVMLSQFKWISGILCEKYYEDQDKLLKEIKITDPTLLDELTGTDKSNSTLCEICFSKGNMVGPYCGHKFCLSCWILYLTLKVRDDYSHAILCPGYGCNALVEDEEVCRMINDPSMRSKHMRLVANNFVRGSQNIVWCKAPKCDYAIMVNQKGTIEVTCKCGTRFCLNCGSDVHFPADCNHMRKWNENISAIKAPVIKNCPLCCTPIEKNGRCNHMVCKQCKASFCWICLDKWTMTHYCNIYNPDTSGEDSDTKLGLACERFAFYNERYHNYIQGLILDKNLEEKLDTGEFRFQFTTFEKEYFKQILDVLRCCQEVLACAYIFSFFLVENNYSAIFNKKLQYLHIATEDLSFQLELEMFKIVGCMQTKTHDMRDHCSSRKSKLLKCVKEGYHLNQWKFGEYEQVFRVL